MLRGKVFERYATVDGDMITVHADRNSSITVRVTDKHREDWPELFAKKPVKRRRRKKAVNNDDVSGDVEPSSE